jgi:hypothetical protein
MDANNFKYYSVDKNPMIVAVDGTKHLTIDVYADNFGERLRQHLGDSIVDVVIIDIEPHGNEFKIYQNIPRERLANEHLIVLHCLGCIDMYGTYMAETFLNLIENDLHDVFGVNGMNHFGRDVFAIVRKNDEKSDRRMMIRDEILRLAPPPLYVDPPKRLHIAGSESVELISRFIGPLALAHRKTPTF